MKVPVEKVTVGKRYREDFSGLEDLKDSLKTKGQIQPIIVDENLKLVAGERRLRAAREVGWKEIEAIKREDLDEIGKKDLELEENIQRKQFTWQEEVTAKQQLHTLKQKIHGKAVKGHDSNGWKFKDTASALGENVAIVNRDIQLAQGIKAFPELLKEKNKSKAFKKLQQKREQVLRTELAKRTESQEEIQHPSVIFGDCVVETAKLQANSVDLTLTDPPFGVGIDKAKTFGGSSPQVVYEDDPYETFDLLDKLCPKLYQVLKDDRHLIIFCGIQFVERVVRMLSKHNFTPYPIPLIWDKGSGSYAGQKTSFVHSYETAVHAKKGSRKFTKDSKDVFSVKRLPPNKKVHPTEKPPELLRELIDILSLPGELVLDTFAGSGSTLKAAREMNRRAVGIEKDKTYYQTACKKLKEE